MERAIEFLTGNQADQSTKLSQLIEVTNKDAENIRALARIADIHERRLTRLENGESEKA